MSDKFNNIVNFQYFDGEKCVPMEPYNTEENKRRGVMTHPARQDFEPITNILQRAKALLEESFHRLYPRNLWLSSSTKQIRKELREFDMEFELENVIKDIVKTDAKVRELLSTVYMDVLAYESLSSAAQRSTWMPKEYSANDWLADCVFFLENGHPKETAQHLPIHMVLYCFKCDTQHVDQPETDGHYAERLHEWGKGEVGLRGNKPEQWKNPPHKSHLCHKCGHIWRPADVHTNGVLFIQTKGRNDSPLVKKP